MRRYSVAPKGHKAEGEPIRGDEVNWGFTGQHAVGYWYMVEQNQRFAQAMRWAIERGYEQETSPDGE